MRVSRSLQPRVRFAILGDRQQSRRSLGWPRLGRRAGSVEFHQRHGQFLEQQSYAGMSLFDVPDRCLPRDSFQHYAGGRSRGGSSPGRNEFLNGDCTHVQRLGHLQYRRRRGSDADSGRLDGSYALGVGRSRRSEYGAGHRRRSRQQHHIGLSRRLRVRGDLSTLGRGVSEY